MEKGAVLCIAALVLAVVLSLSPSSSLFAQEVRRNYQPLLSGMEAYQKGEYKRAPDEFLFSGYAGVQCHWRWVVHRYRGPGRLAPSGGIQDHIGSIPLGKP